MQRQGRQHRERFLDTASSHMAGYQLFLHANCPNLLIVTSVPGLCVDCTMPSDYQRITQDNIRRRGEESDDIGELLSRELYSGRTHFIYELL
jgi:hypothetical protein